MFQLRNHDALFEALVPRQAVQYSEYFAVKRRLEKH